MSKEKRLVFQMRLTERLMETLKRLAQGSVLSMSEYVKRLIVREDGKEGTK